MTHCRVTKSAARGLKTHGDSSANRNLCRGKKSGCFKCDAGRNFCERNRIKLKQRGDEAREMEEFSEVEQLGRKREEEKKGEETDGKKRNFK